MNNGMMWLLIGLGALMFFGRGTKAIQLPGSAPAPGKAGSLGYQISGDPLYD